MRRAAVALLLCVITVASLGACSKAKQPPPRVVPVVAETRGPEERSAPGQGHRERGSVQYGNDQVPGERRDLGRCLLPRRAGRAEGQAALPHRPAPLRVRPPAGRSPHWSATAPRPRTPRRTRSAMRPWRGRAMCPSRTVRPGADQRRRARRGREGGPGRRGECPAPAGVLLPSCPHRRTDRRPSPSRRATS